MRLYALFARVLPDRFQPERRLDTLVRKLTGGVVCQGPFAGMKYVHTSVGSAYLPKLLGTYELELHPVVESIAAGAFEVLVNIGAAEGYYAVGLARRCAGLSVVAFERDPAGQEAIRHLARENGVPGISILGNCEPQDLARALQGVRGSLVICDIEGGELQVLDPAACPALADAHILVELHEFAVQGIAGTIRRRFEPTHHIEEIPGRARTLSDFPLKSPWLSILPNYALLDAMREWRPGQTPWFWMTPRRRS
jgi:hypothetical protein